MPRTAASSSTNRMRPAPDRSRGAALTAFSTTGAATSSSAEAAGRKMRKAAPAPSMFETLIWPPACWTMP
ncbi:hypothetical protein D3C72_1033840 [compost metagenome]